MHSISPQHSALWLTSSPMKEKGGEMFHWNNFLLTHISVVAFCCLLSLQGDFNTLGSHNHCSWSFHLWTEHNPRCHGAFSQVLKTDCNHHCLLHHCDFYMSILHNWMLHFQRSFLVVNVCSCKCFPYLVFSDPGIISDIIILCVMHKTIF